MKKLVLLVLSGLMMSCSCKPSDTLVVFMEQERGVDPYQTRMIVTEKFMRIDDGANSESYVIFDRVKKVVYSVNAEEKSVMAVHEKKFPQGKEIKPPFELNHSVKEVPVKKDAPTIDGKKARHYQLITNNEVCYNVVAVKGLMPTVVTALVEFHRHMATDSMLTFNNMPADMHDACAMTKSTFNPVRQFQFGFPVQEWGKGEYLRSLVDYKSNYKADPALFTLPEGYHRYTVQELREGKVNFAK